MVVPCHKRALPVAYLGALSCLSAKSFRRLIGRIGLEQSTPAWEPAGRITFIVLMIFNAALGDDVGLKGWVFDPASI